MQDEPDPPRKFYGFKERDFERANQAGPAGKIDVNDLIRSGAGPLGVNSAKNRENEIHAILRENLKRDVEAGAYDLGVLDDSKRRRRIRNYWIAIVAFDAPFTAYAFWIGHGAAMPFTCSIAAIALFTSYLTWQTFFLRTHY